MKFELKNGEHKSVMLLWVCHEYNIELEDLISKLRFRELVRARSLIVKLLRDKNETLESIGLVINRDHASVLHLLKKHDYYCKDELYFNTYLKLSKYDKTKTVKERIEYHQNEINKLIKLM